MQTEFLPFPTFPQISVIRVAHSLEQQLLQEPCMSAQCTPLLSDNGLLKYLKKCLKRFKRF